jgi:iron complex outermembrane receptor protein
VQYDKQLRILGLQSTRKLLKRLPLALLVTLVSPTVWSQTVSNATELTEVVVTAQRKTENLQDVPVSVQAIGEQELTQANIRDIRDIALKTPGVDLVSAQPGNAIFSIRGIYPIGGNPTTALYLDDVPITGGISGGYANSPEPFIADTTRVEILKGPQGTLYGDSSLGGAIKYVTNLPNASAFSGHWNVEGSTTEDAAGSSAANATLNVPLVSNTLALRASVGYREDGGYLDNVSPYTHQVDGTNVNGFSAEAGRISLAFTPNDTLSIIPALTYQGYHTDDRPYASVPGSELLRGSGPQPPFWMTTGLGPYQMEIASSEPSSDYFYLGSITVQKSFAAAVLTSISSYYKRSDDVTTDPTAFIDGIVTGSAPAVVNAFYPIPTNSYSIDNENDLTQEIRLASNNAKSPFEWTLGVFARRQHFYSTQYLISHGLTANLEQEVGPGTTLANYFPGSLPNDFIFIDHQSSYINNLASFGELGYKLTDALKLTAGVRVYQISQKQMQFSDGWLAGGPSRSILSTETFRGNNPRFVADYKITPDDLVYVSATKGFRQGELNSPVPVPLCSADLATYGLTQVPLGVKPDSLWNYEAGSKNEFFGGRLRVNGALYQMNWTDIQLNVGLPHCQYSFNENAGDARVRGGELAVDAQIVENVTIGLGYNHTDGVLTSVVPNALYRVGDELPFAPKYMATGYVEYSHTFPGAVRGYIRADYMKRGDGVRDASVNSDLPWYVERGWDELDGSVGAEWNDWNARLFVRNALNTDASVDYINYWGQWRNAPQRPRTIGLNIGMRF